MVCSAFSVWHVRQVFHAGNVARSAVAAVLWQNVHARFTPACVLWENGAGSAAAAALQLTKNSSSQRMAIGQFTFFATNSRAPPLPLISRLNRISSPEIWPLNVCFPCRVSTTNDSVSPFTTPSEIG